MDTHLSDSLSSTLLLFQDTITPVLCLTCPLAWPLLLLALGQVLQGSSMQWCMGVLWWVQPHWAGSAVCGGATGMCVCVVCVCVCVCVCVAKFSSHQHVKVQELCTAMHLFSPSACLFTCLPVSESEIRVFTYTNTHPRKHTYAHTPTHPCSHSHKHFDL